MRVEERGQAGGAERRGLHLVALVAHPAGSGGRVRHSPSRGRSGSGPASRTRARAAPGRPPDPGAGGPRPRPVPGRLVVPCRTSTWPPGTAGKRGPWGSAAPPRTPGSAASSLDTVTPPSINDATTVAMALPESTSSPIAASRRTSRRASARARGGPAGRRGGPPAREGARRRRAPRAGAGAPPGLPGARGAPPRQRPARRGPGGRRRRRPPAGGGRRAGRGAPAARAGALRGRLLPLGRARWREPAAAGRTTPPSRRSGTPLSKRPFGPPVGLAALAEAARLGLPLVALGGVEPGNAPRAFAAGATGVAAIRCWLDPAAAVAALLGGQG